MPTVADITAFLDAFAPPALAEPWDNVGLLLGDRAAEITAVMTCLTLSPDVAAEAVRGSVGLVVTHHPILFRPVQRITTDTPDGAALLSLARHGVAVYSPHTAFDSAALGINARLADRLGLKDVAPLRPVIGMESKSGPSGAGRYGRLDEPAEFSVFIERVRAAADGSALDAVPPPGAVRKVAVACGAAAEFLPDAAKAGCDVLVTGEARFHAAVEARSLGLGLVLLGHYASERFAVEDLAGVLAERFPSIAVWASRDERDPIVRF